MWRIAVVQFSTFKGQKVSKQELWKALESANSNGRNRIFLKATTGVMLMILTITTWELLKFGAEVQTMVDTDSIGVAIHLSNADEAREQIKEDVATLVREVHMQSRVQQNREEKWTDESAALYTALNRISNDVEALAKDSSDIEQALYNIHAKK